MSVYEAIHVAIAEYSGAIPKGATYAAATAKPDALLALRGDVNSLDCPPSPESAIFESASALNKSTSMYRTDVKIGQAFTSGSSVNSGRSSGAWW